MKKLKEMILTGLAISLIGCSSNTTSSITSSNTSNINMWHVSPTIEATSLKNLAPLSKHIVRTSEHTGALIENMNGHLNEHASTGYTDNAIIIQKGDEQFIYDYHGNLLYTLSVKVSDTYNEEGITVGYAYLSTDTTYLSEVYGAKISDSKAIVLNTAFSAVTEIDSSKFIYHPFDGNQLYDDIAIQDDKKGLYSFIKNKDGKDTANYKFTEFDGYLADTYIAKNVNSKLKIESTVVADNDAKVLSEVDGEILEKESGMFVNGFFGVYKEEDGIKKIALENAENGQRITEYEYIDIGYFQNGYCPVENSDKKWAYIDTEGNLVTDFIFDGASSLYDGKAWVMKDGTVGVINLKDNIKSTPLSEEDIYSDTSVGDVHVEAEATPESTDTSVIGTVKVNVDSLNIRKEAGTSSDKNGTAIKGETYDVYETKDVEGYTWYRIGENQWIASGDGWVTYTEK